MSYQGRKVDTAPILMRNILSTFGDDESKVGVATKLVSANMGRILLFVTSPDYRLSIARDSAEDETVTLEQSENYWQSVGMSFHGKFCVPFHRNSVAVAGCYSTGKDAPKQSEATPLKIKL